MSTSPNRADQITSRLGDDTFLGVLAVEVLFFGEDPFICGFDAVGRDTLGCPREEFTVGSIFLNCPIELVRGDSPMFQNAFIHGAWIDVIEDCSVSARTRFISEAG